MSEHPRLHFGLVSLNLRLANQGFDRLVQGRAMDMREADGASAIEQIKGGPTLHAVELRDGAIDASGPPRSPGYAFASAGEFDLVAVDVAVDAEDDERPLLILGDERPLVGVESPARGSPIAPKIQQDDLAPVIAQPEGHAIDVFTGDFRSLCADGKTVRLGHRLAVTCHRSRFGAARQRDCRDQ